VKPESGFVFIKVKRKSSAKSETKTLSHPPGQTADALETFCAECGGVLELPPAEIAASRLPELWLLR
jgi:hypothetical protein